MIKRPLSVGCSDHANIDKLINVIYYINIMKDDYMIISVAGLKAFDKNSMFSHDKNSQ